MSAVFDAYSATYGDVVQDSIAFAGLQHDFFVDAKVRLLSALFADHFGSRRPSLLDVGCGVGVMHGPLRNIVGALAGTDVSGDALRCARERHADVDYRQGEGGSLPWPEAAFDAVLAVCVLHHVIPQERRPLLAEMKRVTRPGGLVIVIEHNPWNPLTRLAVRRCPFDRDAVLLSAGEGRTLLHDAGLHGIDARHFLVFPVANRWTERAEKRLRRAPIGAQFAVFGTV
jgi:ubiquinone/menaquinone biosynthesis C-methylase UbiE